MPGVALFLVWKVASVAEDTLDESSHFEALPLHLQPLVFQAQDDKAWFRIIFRSFFEDRMAMRVPHLFRRSFLLSEVFDKMIDRCLKKTNSKQVSRCQAACLKVESQPL